MKFINRVAVVTGGSAGIGAATVRKFRENNVEVAIWDVQDGSVLADEFNALFISVDVTDQEQVETALERTIQRFGHVDILVNNAGIARDKSLLKMDPATWQQVIDVNLTGVFRCTQVVAAHMKERGYGRIVSASSIVGRRGSFGQSNYAAAKGGIIAMTKGWAMELGPHGITVNCIAPGYVDTDMTKGIPEDIKQTFIDNIPVKRIGTPDDIAHGYIFLCADDSGFINGTCLGIDGGVAR